MWIIRSNKNDNLSDNELLEKYRNSHDQNYVGILFERYSHLVFGGCMKYFKNEDDSKDATLQIFEKLLDDLKKHEVQYFKSWLYMVVKNHCLMEIRKNKGIEVSSEDVVDISNNSMESDLNLHHNIETEKEDQLQKLEGCIETLKSEHKDCIDLFFLQEKCYQEIVEITGYALSKVKSYLQNAKRNLKICMENKNEPQLRKI
ncbi:MAG: RNA polymerase subunit sigma-70 [Bacteroidetes bacterium]|nr:MAG: RNA polymerase subunit sigma-70 [Bacteroidota bacterium]